MKQAAERLRVKIMRERPEYLDGSGVVNVAVTIDRTWQKHGHSSKIGVICIISILTVEVIGVTKKKQKH